MAEPFETLVFVARLTRGEKDAIFGQAAAFPGSDLALRLVAAIDDVCLDRLLRAEGCLELARTFASQAAVGANGEELFRTAVGRAYYSAHHSIRGIALWHSHWDPDGHEASIKQLQLLLTDSGFVAKSGLAPDAWKRVVDARTNRHVADYSPYDWQRDPPAVTPVGITGQDWKTAADFNLALAEDLFKAAVRFVGS